MDWQTPPPVAVGSRMDLVALFLGRRLAYTYEVVELVPGRRLVMRTADGPFPMETISRVAAPIMRRGMRRAATKDLARLKALLEAGERAN